MAKIAEAWINEGCDGGEDRIRTCGGFEPTHAFQACPLSRSGTSPRRHRVCDLQDATLAVERLGLKNGGEGGIRTRDPGCPRYRFSKPALSSTQPPLPNRHAEQDASTIVKAPWQRPIFPHLAVQYRQRYDVSLPCSGWERVVPSRSYHQGAFAILCNDLRLSCRSVGSGGRIRTCDLRVMSPTSYHCSTPHRANQCATR